MSSEQARREDVVKEREVKVAKDKVPTMISPLESMAEKSKDSDTLKQQQSHYLGEAENRENLTEKGREEKESGFHGFHGEKARHAQLLAAGGAEMRERPGQELAGGVPSTADTISEKGRQAEESVGKGAQETGNAAYETRQRVIGDETTRRNCS